MAFINAHILSLIIFVPILGAAVVLLLPQKWVEEARQISLAFFAGVLALSAIAYLRIKGTGEFEIQELYAWMSSLNINYHIGMDGVSSIIVPAMAFIFPLAAISVKREAQIKNIFALILMAEGLSLGIFLSVDMFLFFVFFQLFLVSVWLMSGIWGTDQKISAANKSFVFFLLSGAVLLSAILSLANAANSFNILEWYAYRMTFGKQLLFFLMFAVPFAIMIPVIGLHSWITGTLKCAPTAAKIIILCVTIKIGLYGFFRIVLPLFPAAVLVYSDTLLIIAIVGVFFAALLALAEKDLIKSIAYLAISEASLILFGLCSVRAEAASGALLVIVSSALCLAGLASLVSIEDRSVKRSPHYRMFALLFAFAMIGLPFSAKFAGQFLMLLGSFQTKTYYTVAAVAGLVFFSASVLVVIGRTIFRTEGEEGEEDRMGLGLREYLVLVPTIVVIVLLGVWPQKIISKTWQSSDAFSKLAKRVEMMVPASGGNTNRIK